MRIKSIMVFLLSALIALGAFYMPVYGAYGSISSIEEAEYSPKSSGESMVVNASWLDDEMLRIDVVDVDTGVVSSLAVRLSDFVSDAENSRYIMIQAVDLDGNLSGVVQISNPFYNPELAAIITGIGQNQTPTEPAETGGDYYNDEVTESPQLGLTPDGTGSVVDNIVTQNDLEFFTVFTEAGNVFYLVIDRQGNTDNVYLLNAVTESDLMALAERDGNPIDNTTVSGIPAPPATEPPAEEMQPPITQPEITQPDIEETPQGNNGGVNFILIAVVMVAIGGVAYYFKIVRTKKPSTDIEDEGWYDDDDEDEYLDSDSLREGGDD